MPDPASGVLVAPTLITAAGAEPLRGAALGSPTLVSEAGIAWEDGAITYAGPADGLSSGSEPERLEGTIAPGFVDCHTHLPFFGWRADEFEARLAGKSYRDLHGDGGIYRSSRLLNEATDDEVLAFCRPLIEEMANHGTIALELKTGYGLSVEAELRQARLARRLADEAPQTCTVTLLACHAVPKGMERADWVRSACDELIPAVAAEALADAVDIYVEDIAFSLEDLSAVGQAAAANGLPLRCHADQLGASGAAEAAVALGARSADHLNNVSANGITALGSGRTVGVLLPSSTFFIGAAPPSVRAMVSAGAAVAIATDFNPGTSPVLSMPEAIAMGCTLYGLTPHEALTASTLNPATVMGLADRLGTLEVGKRADFIVLDGDAFRQVPYRPGHNPVLHTYIGGRRVGGR
jgi:imidazolonepropionase